MLFKSLNFQPWIINTLNQNNIFEATKIQSVVFGKHNNDKSLLITAPTGSGKTFCFCLPILNNIDLNQNKIQAFIVLPTKELANQIYSQFNLFKKANPNLKIKLVHENKDLKFNTKNVPQVVIGTPSKIDECFNLNKNLVELKYFVLDEADMLVDFGFYKSIASLFDKVNHNNLTKYALSASLHHSLANQLKKFLGNSKVISVSDSIWLNERLTHNIVYQTQNNNDAKSTLNRLMKIINPFFGIIFTNTKNEAIDLYNELIKQNYNVGLLHKDLSPRQRKSVFNQVKNNVYQFLVATDLVARGVDLPQAELVISYGLPNETIWYIHRSGRVGRYKNKGQVYLIYHSRDDRLINNLIKKGIKWNFLCINKDNQLVNKSFKLRLKKPQLLDLKTNGQIKKLVLKSTKKVKPGYKKKLKEKINKIKQKQKRQAIEKKIKQTLLMKNIARTKKKHQ